MSRSIASFVIIFSTLYLQTYCEFFIDNFQRNSDVSPWAEHSDTVMAEGKSKASLVLHSTGMFRRAVLFTMLNPQSCGAALAGIKKNVTLDIRKFKTISLNIRGQGQYRGYEIFLRQRENVGSDYPNYIHYFEAPLFLEQDLVQLLVQFKLRSIKFNLDRKFNGNRTFSIYNHSNFLLEQVIEPDFVKEIVNSNELLPLEGASLSIVYDFTSTKAPADFETVRLHIKNFKPFLMGEMVEDAKPLDKSHITSIGIVAYGGAHLIKKQRGIAGLEINWIKLE